MAFPALSAFFPSPWTPWASSPLSADNPPVEVSELHLSSPGPCDLLGLSHRLAFSPAGGRWGISRATSTGRGARAPALWASKGGAGLLPSGAGAPRRTASSRSSSPLCSAGTERAGRGLEGACLSAEAAGRPAAFPGFRPTQDFTSPAQVSAPVASS